MKFVIALMFLVLGAQDLSAEWVVGKGEFLFGPNTTENTACEKAEKKAKQNAIRAVSGERVKTEDLMACQYQKGNSDCIVNELIWTKSYGLVQDIREKKRVIAKEPGGFQKCIVSLEADVIVSEGQPDPSFDMTVSLNQRVFKDGEEIKISVEMTQPMFLSIFQWLPYGGSTEQVSRLFPNNFDPARLFKNKTTIPTSKNKNQYGLEVHFPKALLDSRKYADEYLIVLGTRRPVTFRDTYSIESFNRRLSEIPQSQRREIRKAYNVFKR